MKNATRHGESTERHWTIRFELNNPLEIFSEGVGDAEATRLKFVDVDYELSDQIITVYSLDLPEGFVAPAETRGRAVWAPEAKRYEIVSMPHKARWIEYTLHATGGQLAGATATHLVTVTEYHDGADPDPDVEGITVHFEELWEANVGNVGKAILGSDGNYHNLVIDCLT